MSTRAASPVTGPDPGTIPSAAPPATRPRLRAYAYRTRKSGLRARCSSTSAPCGRSCGAGCNSAHRNPSSPSTASLSSPGLAGTGAAPPPRTLPPCARTSRPAASATIRARSSLPSGTATGAASRNASPEPYASPSAAIRSTRAPTESPASVTFRNPGPVTSTPATPGAATSLFRSTSATSRGGRPASRASRSATLLAHSPAPPGPGRSTTTRSGTATASSPPSTAERTALSTARERSAGVTAQG